jgi:hypothetical protein
MSALTTPHPPAIPPGSRRTTGTVVSITAAARRRRQAAKAKIKGDAARTLRKEFKQALAALPKSESATAAAYVLLTPPEDLERLEVGDLFLAVRGIGKAGAKAIFSRKVINPWRELRELTDAERQSLARELCDISSRYAHRHTRHWEVAPLPAHPWRGAR